MLSHHPQSRQHPLLLTYSHLFQYCQAVPECLDYLLSPNVSNRKYILFPSYIMNVVHDIYSPLVNHAGILTSLRSLYREHSSLNNFVARRISKLILLACTHYIIKQLMFQIKYMYFVYLFEDNNPEVIIYGQKRTGTSA